MAQGLSKKFGFEESEEQKQFIDEFIEFHLEWTENKLDEIQCFTIREIAATLKALSNKDNHLNPYQIIMIIYGARYNENGKNELSNVLNKYKYLKKLDNKELIIPENFPEYFKNESIERVIRSILFSLENNRHVIITGKGGNGKTQLAKWFAQYWNKERQNKKDEYFCICTKNITCYDLIGRQTIIKDFQKKLTHSILVRNINKNIKKNTIKEFFADCCESGEIESIKFSKDLKGNRKGKCYILFKKEESISKALNKNGQKLENNILGIQKANQIVRWKSGFLLKAIIKGNCAILDSIEEAPSIVTERLNSLLDKKYDGNENNFFNLNENTSKKKVKIDNKFRLICICDDQNIKDMSPAFINRFDVIYFDEQLNIESLEKVNEFIEYLLKKIEIPNHIKNNNFDEKSSKLDSSIIESIKIDSDNIPTNLLLNKIKEIKDNKELFEKYVMGESIVSFIYRFCRTVKIFNYLYGNNYDKIIDFAFGMITDISNFIIENDILNKILNNPIFESNETEFFFNNTTNLKSFLAKLHAASLINMHLIIEGRTGIGKTSAAIYYAKKRGDQNKYFFHSFHIGTQPIHFYGSSSLNDKNNFFRNGSLTNALIQGTVFIADEFNLSQIETMKSLAPSLELNNNLPIYIPGLQNKIIINPNFFFIACQNLEGTSGRNKIPKTISKRVQLIRYPEPEFKIIIREIYNNINEYDLDNEIPDIISNFFDYFNNNLNEIKFLNRLSLRDIKKIIKRIKEQKKSKKFENIELYHNIFFYILSPISEKNIKNVIQYLIKCLKEIFPKKKEINDLQKVYEEKTKLIIEKGIHYLKKGKFKINFEQFMLHSPEKSSANYFFEKEKNIETLYHYYDSMFKILLSCELEPILISGETCYKTHLAKELLNNKNISIVSLNKESDINQLLGNSIFLNNEKAIQFYLKYFDLIGGKNYLKNEENKNEILQKLELDVKQEENEFKNKILDVLKEKYKKIIMNEKNNENSKINIFQDINVELRPGLFLDSLFREKSLILKNLTNLSTEILERFNELFSTEPILTLNEDIYDTFTKEQDKDFKIDPSKFRVIATCHSGTEFKLSEAVLSRFTVISVQKFDENEENFIFSQIKNDIIKEEDILYIIQKISNINNKFMANISKNNIIDILINKVKNKKLINTVLLLFTLGYINEKKLNLEEKSQKIFNKYDIENYGNIFKERDYNKFRIDNFEKGLFSNLTNLKINLKDVYYENDENIEFTSMFKELIEILHFGIFCEIPILLEGISNMGKTTAINYIKDILNYKIISIRLTKNNKVEELFIKKKINMEKDKINIEETPTTFFDVLKDEKK